MIYRIQTSYLLISLFLISCANTHKTNVTFDTLKSNKKHTQEFDFYTSFSGDLLTALQCARKTKKSIIVAHRGGIAPWFPENSTASFKRVLNHAPIMLEVDVVSSHDGVNFLHHDHTLERTTNGKGAYEQFNWDAIAQLKLKDNAAYTTEYSPVKFDEFIDEFGQENFLMLDLKKPHNTSALVNNLQQKNMLRSTIFIAYTIEQAKEIISVSNEVIVALGEHNLKKFNALNIPNKHYKALIVLASNADVVQKIYKEETVDNHYMLIGTYAGQTPPDARLATDHHIPELLHAGNQGVQLIVSNLPLHAHQYLVQRELYINPDECL